MKRRELLQWMAFTGVASSAPRWVLAAGQQSVSGKHLISVFLRGAADGLTVCAPLGEGRYFDARPTLAVAESSALPLDGFFGLHPAATGLKTLFDDGQLAVVHATGLASAQRSHFEAQAAMEHGIDAFDLAPVDGWLGRYLAGIIPDSPLTAVALDKAVPLAMTGIDHALALGAIDDFSLQLDARAQSALRMAYAADPLLAPTAEAALDAVSALAPIAELPTGTGYPPGPLGTGLADAARLIRGESGLVAAAVNSGGWDHHDSQAPQIEGLLAQLGDALVAFRNDLGEKWADTTVIVQTEFGRRLRENASSGTDHGHGGVMLAAGGGVNGGMVFADWPGLAPGDLSGGEDLAVTTDYRQVLAEMLARRFGVTDLEGVFPGWSPGPWQDIFQPAAATGTAAAHGPAEFSVTRPRFVAPRSSTAPALEIPPIPTGRLR
jgi:uncharacterized protein (DUF1501 family)